jgi:hypothetical protein
VGTIVIIGIIGTICCCSNRTIAKRVRAIELELIKLEPKPKLTEAEQSLQSALAIQLGKKMIKENTPADTN